MQPSETLEEAWELETKFPKQISLNQTFSPKYYQKNVYMSQQAFKGQGWRLKSPFQFNWLSLSLATIWIWMVNVSKIKFLKNR